MKKLICLFGLCLLVMTACNSSLSTNSKPNEKSGKHIGESILTAISPMTEVDQKQVYDHRYQLNTLNQKLVDNTGNGYEPLYGVRNFRIVLRGILYRGGANNVYNKYKVRENQNPLQDMALKNLCGEGFKSAIYLYTTNFSTASKSASCVDFQNQANRLNYQQITALDEKNTDQFLEMFYKAIKGQIPSPIYIHCWNGWHASGLVSTLALRQFCGLDADQALQYWSVNTDGNNKGYTEIKNRIRDFKPRARFQITDSERREICLPN